MCARSDDLPSLSLASLRILCRVPSERQPWQAQTCLPRPLCSTKPRAVRAADTREIAKRGNGYARSRLALIKNRICLSYSLNTVSAVPFLQQCRWLRRKLGRSLFLPSEWQFRGKLATGHSGSVISTNLSTRGGSRTPALPTVASGQGLLTQLHSPPGHAPTNPQKRTVLLPFLPQELRGHLPPAVAICSIPHSPNFFRKYLSPCSIVSHANPHTHSYT